jgi:eukaryotic-like serine/threonine-protein kinase
MDLTSQGGHGTSVSPGPSPRPLDARDQEDGAAPGPTHRQPRLATGAIVGGKYLVQETLGVGGWAVVYGAEHLALGHRVALKVLHVEDTTPSASAARFRREARLSAAASHRNILQVYDMGHLQDGSPYLVMERLQGETLTQRLDRGGLPIAGVIELGNQLLCALTGLAAEGIVHRDIKPHNIVLHRDSDGQTVVKLLDFGISTAGCLPVADRALTHDGMVVGTPHYMAPEQVLGQPVDTRTDLYAVSVVLYEALAGVTPFDAPATGAILAATLHDEVPPLRRLRRNCPPALERIIRKGLAKDPSARYPYPQAMRRALTSLARAHGLPSGNDAWSAPDLPADARGRARAVSQVRHRGPWVPPRLHRALLVGLLGIALGSVGGALAARDGAPADHQAPPGGPPQAHDARASSSARDSDPPPEILECRGAAALHAPVR